MRLILCDNHLASQRTVRIDEISSNQQHSECPPHQANLESVIRGFSALHCKRIHGIACGKHEWMQAEGHAGEHASQVRAGREKCFALVASSQFEAYPGEPRNGEKRKNEPPGRSDEVLFHLRLNL